jgi:hypothetical protein
VKVGSPGVADQQRVAGKDEPGLVAAHVVRHEVGVMGRSVARGGDRPYLGVAELDDLAIAQRYVLELNSGPSR